MIAHMGHRTCGSDSYSAKAWIRTSTIQLLKNFQFKIKEINKAGNDCQLEVRLKI